MGERGWRGSFVGRGCGSYLHGITAISECHSLPYMDNGETVTFYCVATIPAGASVQFLPFSKVE